MWFGEGGWGKVFGMFVYRDICRFIGYLGFFNGDGEVGGIKILK